MDQSKKTMRHFYCRDVLWETFEQMANDFDCSIDYLVNEAMRYYARSKNYQSPGGPATSGAARREQPEQQWREPHSPAPTGAPGRRCAGRNQPATPQPMSAMGANGRAAGLRPRAVPRRPRRATPASAPRPSANAPPQRQMAHSPAPAPLPPAHRRRGMGAAGPDAVPDLQRPALPGHQGPVHHRPRLQDVGPADQGRQHLAQARGGDPAQRHVLHQGPRVDQRHRLQGHAHRQQAHRRGRRVPPVRLRAAVHVPRRRLMSSDAHARASVAAPAAGSVIGVGPSAR